eukprot:5198284-Heterocapsa_arctica.AAC.1
MAPLAPQQSTLQAFHHVVAPAANSLSTEVPPWSSDGGLRPHSPEIQRHNGSQLQRDRRKTVEFSAARVDADAANACGRNVAEVVRQVGRLR